MTVLLGESKGRFRTVGSFNVGSQPVAAAVADFDGDGKQDMAVLNQGIGAGTPGTVTLLKGNGAGGFTSSGTLTAGTVPISIVAGDFNNDGKMDLAPANQATENVSIFLGNGDGTFQLAREFRAGGSPTALLAGDFNGDGKPDLALTISPGTLSVLLGNGDGTFQSPLTAAVSDNPVALAAGDFNGDGKLDLAVANFGENGGNPGSLSVLLGIGDGTLQPRLNLQTGGVHPAGVAVGDFNGDGNVDIAVANQLSDSIALFTGNGNGTFQPPVTTPAGNAPTSLLAADLDQNGTLDLITLSGTNTDVTILSGTGRGMFAAPAAWQAGTTPSGIALGNFNNDALPDLAVTNIDPNTVSVLLNVSK